MKYRIENIRSGALIGYWDADSREAAIAAMIEDAGGDGEPDEGWPEGYDSGVRAYEVQDTIWRRGEAIETHFVYHDSGRRWAVQYSKGSIIAALSLDAPGTDGTEARLIYEAEDAEAVDNWLGNLSPEDREGELSDYLAFCDAHESGWT